jgi:hypothetical protein
VTIVVIGLGERNTQADNGRGEMVCNDKYSKKATKATIDTGRNNINAKRNVHNAKHLQLWNKCTQCNNKGQ